MFNMSSFLLSFSLDLIDMDMSVCVEVAFQLIAENLKTEKDLGL